jgi:tetratricopeptide (TPR) repeat protein
MGDVYLAERSDDQFRKKVAIKLIRLGMDSEFVLKRFRNERQILASLEHPNIARLLDGGTASDGRPYFVMEYIEGERIDDYCDEQKLTTLQRLELFQKVCSAVHYAHQNLVIHRDIKAGNILVTEDGVPKLLDFGIAKLLDEGRVRSDTAIRAFTPESASPEQVRSEPITVTSDVYSLGALLYRLLTDQKVFDFSSSNDSDIVRAICEREPVAPSDAASRRAAERIERDLDWITLKALRKEPDRRYVSVAQLSEDCERYVMGRPVLAGPDTVGYRTAKFLRRHWVGASAAAAIMVVVAAAGTALWFSQQRAERRFNDIRRLANTLVGELYDSIAEVPGSTSARQLLVTRAVGYLDALSREAGRDTSLKVDLADAYQKIGDVQGNPYLANLGDVGGARASYSKLIDLRTSIHESRADVRSAVALGQAYSRVGDLDLAQGKYAEAVEWYQRALARFDEARGGDPSRDQTAEDRARVLGRRGVALTWAGRRDEAKTALLESIDVLQQLNQRPGSSRVMRRGLAVNHGNLGDVYHYEGDYARALGSHQRAAEIARALLAETPDAITAKRDVVLLLARVGGDLVELQRFEDAVRVTEESIAIEESMIKADPQNVQFQFDLADMYGNLAASQREMRLLREALRSIEHSLNISAGAIAKNPGYVAHRFNYATALRELGLVHRDRHAADEAIRAFRRSIEMFASLPADQRDPKQSLAATADLGHALAEQARRTGAVALAKEAHTTLQQALDGWQAYQKGAGSKEDLRKEIDAVTAALAQVDRSIKEIEIQ